MSYVYHRKPVDQQGSVLYPLNQLSSLMPEVYEREKAKYAGREAALEFRIPYLDLLWNDVLHSAVIHPYHIFSALRTAGVDYSRRPGSAYYYRIPVEAIRERRCVYYRNESFWLNNSPNEDVPSTPPGDEFELFNPDTYREHDKVPKSYMDYLRRQVEGEKFVLLWAQIPHVLIPDPIDVSGMEVVRFDAPPDDPLP
jgi:hypothetical protein